jgi:hypothetical protein
MSLVVAWASVMAPPVLAECSRNVNRWPEFEEVALTAKQVVVGRVIETARKDPTEFSTVFAVEVEDVLKGSAPATIEIDGLRSGLPLRGERSCRVNSVLYAKLGDRIAIAFDGKIPGIEGRVNSAAWIQGRPNSEISNPGLRAMEVNEVRQVVGLPPLPSFRAIISASSASIDGDTLVLEGVPAVPYVSEWPTPTVGSWDVGSFLEGWEAAAGLEEPSAVLSLGTAYGGDRFEVEVTDIEATGETLRMTISTPDGSAPSRVPASASLFLEIGADPRTWTSPV